MRGLKDKTISKGDGDPSGKCYCMQTIIFYAN